MEEGSLSQWDFEALFWDLPNSLEPPKSKYKETALPLKQQAVTPATIGEPKGLEGH